MYNILKRMQRSKTGVPNESINWQIWKVDGVQFKKTSTILDYRLSLRDSNIFLKVQCINYSC